MSGAEVGRCAQIVERDDPHLYATALFAPEPARSRLMVLYAFDCELSRATRASAESLIPRMRLQFWRDVIREAADGGEPKAHEVAAPLARLIQTDPALISDIHELDGGDVLSRMVAGYEAQLDAPFDDAGFRNWARARFGARLGLAGSISPLGPEYGHDADDSVACEVLALGLACRTAARMATERGLTWLPEFPGDGIAALARGEVTPPVYAPLASRARAALADLKALRKTRRLSGEPLVAHLPIAREAAVLARVAADPGALFSMDPGAERPFGALRLAWSAWRGRW